MANNSAGLAPGEHLDRGDHRARSNSLPPSDRRLKQSTATRSRSAPPQRSSVSDGPSCPLASPVLLPPLQTPKLAGQEIGGKGTVHAQIIEAAHAQIHGDPLASPLMMSETGRLAHREEGFLHQDNVDMPDADANADAVLAIPNPLYVDNAAQTQQPDLLDYMQIDPTIEHSDESLRKMAAEIYGPPDSPELPLLQTICRPVPPPLQSLGERSVRHGNADSPLKATLPFRTRELASLTHDGGLSIVPSPVPNGLVLHTPREQVKDDLRLKRSNSLTGSPPAKKAKIEDPNLSIISVQGVEEDQVEIVAIRPVRRSPKQSHEDTSSHSKKPPSNVTSTTSASAVRAITTPPSPNWTRNEYVALAREMYFNFPFATFESRYHKKKIEVAEVFAAVIQAPLLAQTDLGARRVSERRRLEQRVSEVRQEDRELHERDLQRERDQLRPTIEAAIWRKMQREGWVKLEQARNILTETEKQVEELNTQAARGPGRRSSRVLSVEEATEELQAASAELEKAKKAEQRKAKRIEKKGVQSQGRGGKKGKFDDDAPSKPGPKPGYGKGKFI